MIMPIQLLKLSAVKKKAVNQNLIHCLFYIVIHSEEAAGGRFCRSYPINPFFRICSMNEMLQVLLFHR